MVSCGKRWGAAHQTVVSFVRDTDPGSAQKIICILQAQRQNKRRSRRWVRGLPCARQRLSLHRGWCFLQLCSPAAVWSISFCFVFFFFSFSNYSFKIFLRSTEILGGWMPLVAFNFQMQTSEWKAEEQTAWQRTGWRTASPPTALCLFLCLEVGWNSHA